MLGNPKEESLDLPAPPAASQHSPYSLMFRPKGVIVLSLAIAFLCLSDQQAFISSPVMNSEGYDVCVWLPPLIVSAPDVRGRPPDSGIQALLKVKVKLGQGEAGLRLGQGAAGDEDPDWGGPPEEAHCPSSTNVPDKMDRKNRLVYPLPLRTLKRVPVALCMSVSSVQSL
ncbi:unnamed protein product [Boreogadus saida]